MIDCSGFKCFMMSDSESLECEAPASLLNFAEMVRIIRSNAKRRRGAAVQSQAEAPDIKTINTRDKFLTKIFLPTSWDSVGEFSVSAAICFFRQVNWRGKLKLI